MAPISHIGIEPLKPEEFIRFDAKPNSSLVALKKSDFAGNDLWVEFVSRYVRTAKYNRTKYYLERMSDPLKEDLIFAIASLWREAPQEETKNELRTVLEQDFQIDPAEIKARSDVNEAFDKDKEEVTTGFFYYEDNDPIRNSHYLLISGFGGGQVLYPFRFLDSVRIAPKIRLDGANVIGDRKLEGEKEETIGYQVGMLTGDMQIRDSQREIWNVGGNLVLTGRQNIPTAFSNQSILWKSSGEIDYSPVNFTLSVEGLNEDYLESAEEDQYDKDTNQIKLDIPLTVVLSGAWAMIGGYRLDFNHTVQYYSKEDRTQHNGYLWLRRRWARDYLDIGGNVATESRDKERKADDKVVKDEVERIKSSAGATYFRLLGGGKSIKTTLLLSHVDSRGDLDAEFFEYEVYSNVSFNIWKNVEFNLNGGLVHDLIYQAGREYELAYSVAPGLTWNVTKDVSVIGFGMAQQTKSKGGLNEDTTSLAGNLTVSVAFEVFRQQMRADVVANTGRNYDGVNFDETFIDTNFMLTALF